MTKTDKKKTHTHMYKYNINEKAHNQICMRANKLTKKRSERAAKNHNLT